MDGGQDVGKSQIPILEKSGADGKLLWSHLEEEILYELLVFSIPFKVLSHHEYSFAEAKLHSLKGPMIQLGSSSLVVTRGRETDQHTSVAIASAISSATNPSYYISLIPDLVSF
jgi:hypothetical protein